MQGQATFYLKGLLLSGDLGTDGAAPFAPGSQRRKGWTLYVLTPTVK